MITYTYIMKRTTIFLDEQIERELRAAAEREGRPTAAIVREAVEQYIVAHRRGKATAGFVAVADSGYTDTAERHEELLWTDDQARRGEGARQTGPDATTRRRRARAKRHGRPATKS